MARPLWLSWVFIFCMGLCVLWGQPKAVAAPNPNLAVGFIVAEVLWCETKCTHTKKGTKELLMGPAARLNSPENMPQGIAQFKEPTFTWMAKLAKKPKLRYENASDQVWLLTWGITNGYGDHWRVCYRRALQKYAAFHKQKEHEQQLAARVLEAYS